MKLNYKKTMLVGLAFFAISAFWQAYDSIIPKILTDKFGLSQGVSGVIMALDNVLSLFLLPLFGSISDKCTNKRGRRTPFIIIGTMIASLAFVVLSFADGMQLSNLSDVDIENVEALSNLYDADLTIRTPRGDKVAIMERFEKEDFISITMNDERGNVTTDYTYFVVPARQAYAWKMTVEHPGPIIFFVLMLLVVLISMSIYRSPAVALMPDVTIKPLRSKANAIITLMGTVGGMLILICGVIFKTGATQNALMAYTPFFIVVAMIMLISLVVFMKTVDEPKLVEEMERESKFYGLDEEEVEDNEASGEAEKLHKEEQKSLFLILASVFLWYMGYNAASSKYSVYAGKILGLDYNMTLLVAAAVGIVSFIPVGALSLKIGRKKTVLGGVGLLGVAFGAISFLQAGTPMWVINILFSIGGVGWAAINVNSFPMVVELSKKGDVGKYTGFYYTASMLAQTITPVLSGFLLDRKFTLLFPYAAIFVGASFITMLFVKHGDCKPEEKKSFLENFDVDD